MHDTAHEETSKLLSSLGEKLDKRYQGNWESLKPEIKRQLTAMYLSNENTTEDERIRYAKKDGKLKKLVIFIASSYVLLNKKSLEEINEQLEKIHLVNRQWAIAEIRDAVEEDIKLRHIAFNLSKLQNKYDKRAYDRLKDAYFVSDEIQSRLIRGFRENMSEDELLERIHVGAGFSRDSSMAVLRTETTRIENSVRYETYLQAQRKGIEIEKIWVSILDDKTRQPPRDDANHYDMFGETKKLEEYFSNGLLYPGDPDGEAKEIMYCRCRIVARVKVKGRWKVINGIFYNKKTAK